MLKFWRMRRISWRPRLPLCAWCVRTRPSPCRRCILLTPVLATWSICWRRMRKKDELTAHSCRTYQLCDPKCFLPLCHPLNQLTFFEILLPFSKGDTMVGSRSFHEIGPPDTFLLRTYAR